MMIKLYIVPALSRLYNGIAEFVAVADYCSRAVVYCFLNRFVEILCAALRRSVISAVNAVIGGVAPDAVPHGGII